MDENDSVMRRFFERMLRRFFTEIASGRFWRFFLGTVGGLSTDLLTFTLLTSSGVLPGVANVFSATLGLLVVYFLVTRYAFKTQHSHIKFIGFLVWYASMIILWGVIIQGIANVSQLPALGIKIGTLPFSFGLNFAFNRVLFGDRFWLYIQNVRLKNTKISRRAEGDFEGHP